ncbi:MAG: RIP metalloprotease RseP [Gammaproteobacteria bacterium]|nr:RIP metalloprotease RseP [Gammaproteobacteria bacterium]NIP88065.1 RIP metalloprotease RseP [Gammaproteobacteria bacterium]NIR22575.1 RIP metalloprotease RseP [Gammaproteobacteria bacterium]NIS04474.1 RIP metalloprotease RseP [Gammaproteobacteria bacterium]NIU42432.1 RIP metalloprotease RseP [Gammaproteobacteria bacterium]
MSFLLSVLWFVVAIGVLVTVHEFGHFWVARRAGVKVLRFSVGFGRPLWRRRAGADQTEYVIAAIPLGGYVKMLDENEGEVAEHERHRAFNRQPLGKRVAVVVAGPLFNFLFAIVAYWLMFIIGIGGLKSVIGEVAPGGVAAAAGLEAGQRIVSVDERETRTWQSVVEAIIGATLKEGPLALEVDAPGAAQRSVALDLQGMGVDEFTQGRLFDALGLTPRRPVVPPVIGEVEAGGPADRGGLRRGDRVLALDGTSLGSWREFVTFIRAHPEQSVEIQVERAGARITLVVLPASVSADGESYGRIGAGVAPPEDDFSDYYATVRYAPWTAFAKAIAKTWDMSILTLRMLWKMVTLQISVKHLSGPISIAQYAGISADVGIASYIGFLAIVSISLGILNLLPIPILDGGHLLYYLIESILGRPVSEEAQFFGQRLGIAMLVGLMGLAFYNDLARIFG